VSGNAGTPSETAGATNAGAGTTARRAALPGLGLGWLTWARLRAYWLTPAGVAMLGATALALAIRLYTLTRHGYLTGVTEYDDGVYLGASVRLLQGALPYHDFAFVQPPGIPLLMTPVALIAKVSSATHAMAVARLLTAAASTACVPLAGSLVRYRGALVTVVTCGFLAVYPDDVTTAHTLILEPWMNLCLLVGACLAFRRGHLRSPWWLLWAGVAIGFAGAVKYWAAVPAFMLLLACLLSGTGAARVRRAGTYVLGLAAGFVVPVLPFFAAAPAAFVRSTLLDQAERAGTRVPVSLRLAHLTGLIDFLNGKGHLSLTAGVHSLFASGSAAATSNASAGWLPFFVALIAAAVLVIGYLWDPGRPSPLEWFALASAAAATAAVLSYSAFFYHYPDFAAPWLAIAAGRAAGTLTSAFAGRALVRRALIGAAGLVILAVAAFQAHEVTGLRAPDIYPDQALIPAGTCLVTDEISMAIAADRFTAAGPGCPDVIDSLAMTLTLGNGVSVQGGAGSLPNVVAAWQATFAHARYVWLSPNSPRRIPWTPGLVSWFNAHFQPLVPSGGRGLGVVYKRVGSPG
jgi:alpha-1,2-mannosyltransferase